MELGLVNLLRVAWIAGILPILVASLPIPCLRQLHRLLLGFAARGKIMHSSSPRKFTVPQRYFLHFYVVAVVLTTCLVLPIWFYAYRKTLPASTESLHYSTVASHLTGGAHMFSIQKNLFTHVEHRYRVWRTVFVLMLMEAQVLRRLYETLNVFNYSPSARMHVFGYLTGLFYHKVIISSYIAVSAIEASDLLGLCFLGAQLSFTAELQGGQRDNPKLQAAGLQQKSALSAEPSHPEPLNKAWSSSWSIMVYRRINGDSLKPNTSHNGPLTQPTFNREPQKEKKRMELPSGIPCAILHNFYTAAPLSLGSSCAPQAFSYAGSQIAEFIVKGRAGMPPVEFNWWEYVKPLISLGWCPGVGAVIFIWGWLHQWRCHAILGSLREHRGADEYVIPRGDWFEYVSCPHYLAEIVIYAGILVASGGLDITVWLLFLFVVSNLVFAAAETHRWYHHKFESYPHSRRAILPMIY